MLSIRLMNPPPEQSRSVLGTEREESSTVNPIQGGLQGSPLGGVGAYGLELFLREAAGLDEVSVLGLLDEGVAVGVVARDLEVDAPHAGLSPESWNHRPSHQRRRREPNLRCSRSSSRALRTWVMLVGSFTWSWAAVMSRLR